MRCSLVAAALALAALAACNPSLNWREARFDGSALVALLPCKPDKAARPAVLAGGEVAMQMLGCEAGGATFAVARALPAPGIDAGAALAQWKAATLANLRAAAVQESAFAPSGALALPQSLRATATGQRADGQPLTGQFAWFARSGPAGIELFHAAVYAERLDAQAAEAFISSLKFP